MHESHPPEPHKSPPTHANGKISVKTPPTKTYIFTRIRTGGNQSVRFIEESDVKGMKRDAVGNKSSAPDVFIRDVLESGI